MSDPLRNQLSVLARQELLALAEALVNQTDAPDETPQFCIELMYTELFRRAVALIAEAIEEASGGLKTARDVDPTLYLVGMAGGGYTFGICNKESAPDVISEHGFEFEGVFFLPIGGQKLRRFELCTPEQTERWRANIQRG